MQAIRIFQLIRYSALGFFVVLFILNRVMVIQDFMLFKNLSFFDLRFVMMLIYFLAQMQELRLKNREKDLKIEKLIQKIKILEDERT